MNARVAAGVLGAADGVTSISGVIAGGAGSHVAHAALAHAALGGALAATVSMAGGEMLSQDAVDWRAVGAMGMGTALGSALPALPLLWAAGFGGWGLVVAIALVIGLAVGLVRSRTTGRPLGLSLAQTLLVLGFGAGVGLGAGFI